MKHLAVFLLCGLMSASVSAAISQKLRVGQPFPEMSLVDIQTNQKMTRKDLLGKVAIVDFWAGWCGPCKESFPFYNSLFNERKERGLIIVGVNVDDQIEDAKKFLETNPVAFPLVYDEGRKLTKEIGVATMPTSYILDRKGQVMEIHKGFLNKKKDEITREVDRLLLKK